MKTKALLTMLAVMSLMVTSAVYPQGKKLKINKEMQEALEMRYSTDQQTAKTQRFIFDKMEWKKSWIGVKYTDLLKAWGAPAKAFPNGDGGQVVVYEKVSNYAGGSYKPGYFTTGVNGFGQTVLTGSKQAEDTRWASQYVEVTTVYIGKNNLIQNIDQKTTHSQSGTQ